MLAVCALMTGIACTAATEPNDPLGTVTGKWETRLLFGQDFELDLVESAPGIVTGTGVERFVLAPGFLPPDPAFPDTILTPLTIQGVVADHQVQLEIWREPSDGFVEPYLAYRFAGTVRTRTMRGEFSYVEPEGDGVVFLPVVPPRFPLAFARIG